MKPLCRFLLGTIQCNSLHDFHLGKYLCGVLCHWGVSSSDTYHHAPRLFYYHASFQGMPLMWKPPSIWVSECKLRKESLFSWILPSFSLPSLYFLHFLPGNSSSTSMALWPEHHTTCQLVTSAILHFPSPHGARYRLSCTLYYPSPSFSLLTFLLRFLVLSGSFACVKVYLDSWDDLLHRFDDGVAM